MSDTMKAKVNFELLTFAVQTQMFCPRRSCRKALDARTSVLAIAGSSEAVACANCYDERKTLIEEAAAARNLTLEIIDGRTMKGVR